MSAVPPDDRFDFDEVFDDDYLAFYAAELDDETNDEEAELCAMLLDLEAGDRVLDVPCGHGRIALRFADAGAEVVGIDACTRFLERARRDASERKLDVDFREADMRALAFEGEFDHVVCWFTSFGYDEDDALRDVLRRMRRALVPGGTLLLETMNLHERGLSDQEVVTTKELPRSVENVPTGTLVDFSRFDPHTSRLLVRRQVLRSDRPIREMRFFIRLFSFTELRGWLHDAGFEDVRGFGGDGEVFRVDSRRLVLTARRA